MKKTSVYLFPALTLLLALAALFALVGCDVAGTEDPTGELVDYENAYKWVYDQEFTKEYDDYMKVDGVLDEEVWGNEARNWLTFTQDGCTLSYTTYFTEKGLYIAAIAEDDDIYWNGRMNFNNGSSRAFNSAFFFAVAQTDADILQMQTRFRFAFDTKNKGSYEMTPFAAKATADADVESGDATKMWGELFVTWEDLLVDVDEETGMPDEIAIIPYYRHIVNVEDVTSNKWLSPLFSDMAVTQCYPTWDANGYTAAAPADSVWGNAANGHSASHGWELSQGADGVVTSNQGYYQSIFFKDAYSTSYKFSVDMKIIRGYKKLNSRTDSGDGIFRGGICAMTEQNDLVSTVIVGEEMSGGFAKLYRLRYSPWSWTSFATTTVEDYDWEASDHTVRLEVIKDKENFYYFIEGQFLGYSQESALAGAACPGAFTMSSEATFSNPEYIDYADDPDGLRAALEEYVYLIDASVAVPNGSISVSAPAVDKTAADRTVSITLNPSNGSVLSAFTVNGTDMMDYVKENIDRGVLKLSVDASTRIEVAYTQFSRRYVSDTITLRGEAFLTDGVSRASGAAVRIRDIANPLFDYTLTANAQGKFQIIFLKPRDTAYEIDGVSYMAGSTWQVTVVPPDGYAPISTTVTADSIGEDGILLLPAFVAGPQLKPMGGTSSGSTYNDDGTFTISENKSAVTAGRQFTNGDIQGKNWTAKVEIDASALTTWNTYGFVMKFEDGTCRIIGASQRGSEAALRFVAWRDVYWIGELPHVKSTALTEVWNTYQTKDTLSLTLKYANGTFTLYMNDVSYGTVRITNAGISDPSKIVEVGFGATLNDTLPQGMTFSNWSYTVDGDDTYVPSDLGLPDGLTPNHTYQADMFGYIKKTDSVTMLVTSPQSIAAKIDASVGALGTKWLAEVDIATAEMVNWHTYGVAIIFSNGDYLVVGPSLRGGADLLGVCAISYLSWKGDVTPVSTEVRDAIRASWQSAATLNVKVAYDAGTYSVYLNDTLYGTFTAADFDFGSAGDPVAVGFGARLDDDITKGMTFSGWNWCVDGSDAYAAEKEKLGF